MIINYLVEFVFDIIKDKIELDVDQTILKKRLYDFIEVEQNKNEICSLEEEVDFENLCLYLKHTFVCDMKKYISIPGEQRERIKTSIINKAISKAKANSKLSSERIESIVCRVVDIAYSFYRNSDADIARLIRLTTGEIEQKLDVLSVKLDYITNTEKVFIEKTTDIPFSTYGYKKWNYKIIILDDDIEQMEMLEEQINLLIEEDNRYGVSICCATKSIDVIYESQNIDVDVFVIDVARKGSLKWQTKNFDYFGYDLYNQLVTEKPNVLIKSKFFIVSKLPITTIMKEFEGADIVYLNKQTNSHAEIARVIKEYLDCIYVAANSTNYK